MAEHGDAVHVAIRYTPFHGEASEEANRVLEAARMQGVYEPVLEAILREQPRWASHGAPEPGLILAVAATVGVSGTPTFFVNGKPLDPFGEAELRALVASEVAAAGS